MTYDQLLRSGQLGKISSHRLIKQSRLPYGWAVDETYFNEHPFLVDLHARLGLLHEPVELPFKDYIERPKRNKYQAIHILTQNTELQFQTPLMRHRAYHDPYQASKPRKDLVTRQSRESVKLLEDIADSRAARDVHKYWEQVERRTRAGYQETIKDMLYEFHEISPQHQVRSMEIMLRLYVDMQLHYQTGHGGIYDALSALPREVLRRAGVNDADARNRAEQLTQRLEAHGVGEKARPLLVRLLEPHPELRTEDPEF